MTAVLNEMMEMAQVGPRFVTVREAAVLFFGGRVSPRLIYKLVEEGEIECVRAGNKILLFTVSVVEYLRRAAFLREPPLPGHGPPTQGDEDGGDTPPPPCDGFKFF
jgi:excisionase family DNA binding protein